jgi:hypothetical protein
VTKVFLSDPRATDTSYFTGGGSKDVNDINRWQWSPGDVSPDKDDITNAYAASYKSDGNRILYFGADRFDTSGDAQIGFWFSNNPIGMNPDGTFSGVHAVNDLLVLSDFTQGGKIGTVKL